ncbi:MAG TPA: hypothetical protein VMF30_08845 [Pirellulales bacterium]|nr:hypothetical protein [Pirellulales bacterium]
MSTVAEQVVSTDTWPAELQAELARNAFNGRVGSRLVSETDRVRVWQIHLAPGERLPFHRHVLHYFWTVLTPGAAQSRYADGRIEQVRYEGGETKHLYFAAGEFMIHDLENIGPTPLVYVTVEFLDSPNPPLDLP